MRKGIFVILFILLYCTVANAGIYCLFDRETGEGKGTISSREDYVPELAKRFIVKEGDRSYRGKYGYEIKLDNVQLRHATQQEIDNYFQAKEEEKQQMEENKAKEMLIKLLDNEEVKTKIKNKIPRPIGIKSVGFNFFLEINIIDKIIPRPIAKL